MSECSGMYGLPKAKVLYRKGRIAGYVPVDADSDFHVSNLTTPFGEANAEGDGIQYDPDAECIYRAIQWKNRNTYMEGVGVFTQEEPIYDDSDAKLEQERRTFIAIPTFGQVPNSTTGDGAFISPSNIGPDPFSYPAEYQGPRWRIAKIPSFNGTDQTGAFYSQYIYQQKAGFGVRWAVRQKTAGFFNQPFWISFKKGRTLTSPKEASKTATDTDTNQNLNDPTSGSWLMIVLGGLGGPNPEGGYSLSDQYNSYSIVFPINDSPFVIDNIKWAQYRNYLVANKIANPENNNLAVQACICAKISNPSWILRDETEEFTVWVMAIRNRIFIRTSYAEGAWILPEANIGAVVGSFSQRQQLSHDMYATSMAAAQIGLPATPVEIHGRGFTCGINFNPMEFYPAKAFVTFPPIFYSDDQAVGPWFGHVVDDPASGLPAPPEINPVAERMNGKDPTDYPPVDQSPLCVPAGDKILNSGSPAPNLQYTNFNKGYGFDFNPYTRQTSHGLGKECMIVTREAGYPIRATSFYGKVGGAAMSGDSEVAQLMKVVRYRCTLKQKPPIVNPDGSSWRYRTPFLFRMKFRCETTFVPNADGVDISKHVISIQHSTRQEKKWFISREVKLTLLVPKSTDREFLSNANTISDRTSVSSQDLSILQMSRNHAVVRIWMGLTDPAPSDFQVRDIDSRRPDPRNCYFTGICLGGSFGQTAQRDTLELTCRDFTTVLDDNFLMASPYYDGMSLPHAIASILERGGFAAFRSLNQGTGGAGSVFYVSENANRVGLYKALLGNSGRFSAPLIKFEQGKKLLDICKGFVGKFSAIFMCDRQGSFVLDYMPNLASDGSLLDGGEVRYKPTNDLQHVAEYYSRPQIGIDKHFILLEKKVIAPEQKSWSNVISVATVDNYTGHILHRVDGDPQSIINPSSPNFVGYMKAFFKKDGGFGGKEEADNWIKIIKRVMTQPITMCSIKIQGNQKLNVFDIIKIDNNKYRILDISGQMSIDGTTPRWTMDVNAEHIGYFNDEVDTSENY